jgi:hypothetical protein
VSRTVWVWWLKFGLQIKCFYDNSCNKTWNLNALFILLTLFSNMLIILQLHKIFKLQYNMDIINIPFSWGGYTNITHVIHKLYDSQYCDISIRTAIFTLIYQRTTHSMLRWIFVAYGSVKLLARPQWYTANHMLPTTMWTETRLVRNLLAADVERALFLEVGHSNSDGDGSHWPMVVASWLPAATGTTLISVING